MHIYSTASLWLLFTLRPIFNKMNAKEKVGSHSGLSKSWSAGTKDWYFQFNLMLLPGCCKFCEVWTENLGRRCLLSVSSISTSSLNCKCLSAPAFRILVKVCWDSWERIRRETRAVIMLCFPDCLSINFGNKFCSSSGNFQNLRLSFRFSGDNQREARRKENASGDCCRNRGLDNYLRIFLPSTFFFRMYVVTVGNMHHRQGYHKQTFIPRMACNAFLPLQADLRKVWEHNNACLKREKINFMVCAFRF